MSMALLRTARSMVTMVPNAWSVVVPTMKPNPPPTLAVLVALTTSTLAVLQLHFVLSRRALHSVPSMVPVGVIRAFPLAKRVNCLVAPTTPVPLSLTPGMRHTTPSSRHLIDSLLSACYGSIY